MKIDVEIIRSSFKNAKPISADAMTYFYNYMFENYPENQALPKNVNLENQKKNTSLTLENALFILFLIFLGILGPRN